MDDDQEHGDQETRRVAFLRRHRAALEQQRRLEAERRTDEREIDRANIAKRQSDVKNAATRAKPTATAKAGSGSISLPSLASAEPLVGSYTKFDDLSVEALRTLAEKHALGEMAPLNSRGKYHARFIKDAHPIAGTQFRLERERDMILAAKKRLLLTKTQDPQASPVTKTGVMIGHPQYSKLDYLVDKFTMTLQREYHSVDDADERRRVRMLEVVHPLGLEQFWRLMHKRQLHETLVWLRTHRFQDVNISVVLKDGASDSSSIIVEPNKVVGLTPLMAACRLHHVDLVGAILLQGADPHLTTANGDTAMHCLFHDWQKPQLTSLHRTVDSLLRADHTFRILAMLIKENANVNFQNAFGETPLQHCARLGLVDCVQLLLSHGADPLARDRKGANALDLARTNGFHHITRMLENDAIVERTKIKERERKSYSEKLMKKRGLLSSEWSEEPAALLARLAVEDRRAGHLRNQFVDRQGEVIVYTED